MRKKTHKPLEWIRKNVVFPPQSGSLSGKPVGKHLLKFQTDFIKGVLSPTGEIKKSAFFYGCRKISKTFLFCAIVWYLLNDKKRTGYEIPIVGRVYEQGKILYSQLQSQLTNVENKKDYKIRKDFLLAKKTQNKVHVVYNESASNLGLQSSGAVFDEIGAYKDDSNLQTIQAGMTLSEQMPLLLMASNPPNHPDHFVAPLIRACKKDDDFIVNQYDLPFSEDWQSENNWCKVNPFLAEWKRSKGQNFANVMNNYRMLFRRALESKQAELSFRRLQLGQGLSAELLGFIPLEKIKVAKNFDYKRKDLRWACGIDLSQSHDFTALSFVGWKQQTDELFTKTFLYLPHLNRRGSTQQLQFRKWSQAGYISVQDKAVLDPNEIFDDAYSFLKDKKIHIEGLQIDPSLAGHYIDFFEKNYKVAKNKMTGREMVQSIREVERIGNSGGLQMLEENPAMLWQWSNVLVSAKSKNYVLMDKSSDAQNIDGPVSISLALKFLMDRPKRRQLIYAG